MDTFTTIEKQDYRDAHENPRKLRSTVKRMTSSHIDAVASIERICFSIPWSKSDFIKEIESNSFAYYFVAEVDGSVVAYGGLWHIITEGHITNIAVLPEYRCMGLGEKLLQKIILFANKKEMIGLTLEVRITNIAAQKLYTKHGFAPEGFRKKYYQDTGEDAIIMWKMLNNNKLV